jgi:hypothetical protein
MSLMPCFQPTQASTEGALLGRLLAGYGELELTMCACLIAVEGIFDTPIRSIFGSRGAEKRIKCARRLLLPEYSKANLQDELEQALDDMELCRQIRNQYSHCHWYWTQEEGLCFVNLEELATSERQILELMENRHPVDTALLSAQEAFFNYVKESFTHLGSAYRGWLVQQSQPRQSIQVVAKPPNVPRPPKHN